MVIDMTRIKSCPFCGKEPTIINVYDQFSVDCRNGMCACLPSTWLCDTEEEAILMWNRRSNDDGEQSD